MHFHVLHLHCCRKSDPSIHCGWQCQPAHVRSALQPLRATVSPVSWSHRAFPFVLSHSASSVNDSCSFLLGCFCSSPKIFPDHICCATKREQNLRVSKLNDSGFRRPCVIFKVSRQRDHKCNLWLWSMWRMLLRSHWFCFADLLLWLYVGFYVGLYGSDLKE